MLENGMDDGVFMACFGEWSGLQRNHHCGMLVIVPEVVPAHAAESTSSRGPAKCQLNVIFCSGGAAGRYARFRTYDATTSDPRGLRRGAPQTDSKLQHSSSSRRYRICEFPGTI